MCTFDAYILLYTVVIRVSPNINIRTFVCQKALLVFDYELLQCAKTDHMLVPMCDICTNNSLNFLTLLVLLAQSHTMVGVSHSSRVSPFPVGCSQSSCLPWSDPASMSGNMAPCTGDMCLHVVLGCMYRGHVSACSAWTGDMCLHVVLVALGVLVTF